MRRRQGEGEKTQKRERAQRLVSVSMRCDDVDAMALLKEALGQERFYWRDPRSGVIYVGVGIAADLSAWGSNRFHAIAEQAAKLFADAQIANHLPEFATPHLFGGFSFSDDFTPDNTWSIYAPAQFILPHYQLAISSDHGVPQGWLTINALLELSGDKESDALATAELTAQLQSALQARSQWLHTASGPQSSATAEPLSRNYPMSYPAWEQMLQAALSQFETGRLEKVVLSRVCELRFRRNVDVDQALLFLNAHYPDCYRFLFEPRPYHAFFGASPELLVDLDGRTLTTMGLAGSEPRGKTPDEDEKLGQQLLESPKDRHEHQLVVDALRRRLIPFCTELSIADKPRLLKLSNIQHLYTPVSGVLHRPHTILELLQQLHPTPALGGAPREDALRFISDFEPAPRGWYAAPIGVINRQLQGTFSVAIRSAVTEFERVWLHAGAGIVAASDPQKEWNETAIKFRPILNALGVANQ